MLARDSIEKLRDMAIDLQLIDGTRGIISLFSAREPPPTAAASRRLCSRRRCRGADYDELVQHVMSNEIIRGKLMSDDGKLALIVLALDPQAVDAANSPPSSARCARRWPTISPTAG